MQCLHPGSMEPIAPLWQLFFKYRETTASSQHSSRYGWSSLFSWNHWKIFFCLLKAQRTSPEHLGIFIAYRLGFPFVLCFQFIFLSPSLMGRISKAEAAQEASFFVVKGDSGHMPRYAGEGRPPCGDLRWSPPVILATLFPEVFGRNKINVLSIP